MGEREMVSADEARAMLDGVPDLAEVTAAGQDTLSNAVTGGGRYGAAVQRSGELLGDVERLARTVIALHAIIEGRTVPPTDDELAAHDATGATWMIAHRDRQIVVTAMSWPSSRDWHVAKGAVRWWALAIDGRPCAWPEVSRG